MRMKYLGIDTAARISAAQAKKCAEHGVSFVGRYLVPAAYSKALTAEEIKALRCAGLAILLCWEIGAEAFKQGANRGTQDGAQARSLAEGFGVPAGTVIYFACDYNIPDRDLGQAEAYIKAAQAALGQYVAGAYGPLKLVEALKSRGACRHFWQCVAWSAYFSQEAQTWQYQWQGSPEAKEMAAVLGFAVDLNTCDDLRGAGFWMPYEEYGDGEGGTIIEPAKPAQKPAMWYDGAMAFAKEAGLINDGRPNDPLTRAELATMIMRYDKLVEKKIIEIYKRMQPEDPRDRSGLLE